MAGLLAVAEVIVNQCHRVKNVPCLQHEVGMEVVEDVNVWIAGNCGLCVVCEWRDQDCRRGP